MSDQMQRLQDDFHQQLYRFNCQCVIRNREHGSDCVDTATRVVPDCAAAEREMMDQLRIGPHDSWAIVEAAIGDTE